MEIPDSLLVDLFWWRTTDAASGVLEALLASGQGGALSRPELRRRLSEWPTVLSDGLEDEIIAREFVEGTLAPRLAGQGVVVTGYAQQLADFFPPAGSLRGGSALPASPEVMDLVAQRLRHLLWSAANSEALQEEASGILEIIEEELTR